jgi:hypothetical protein
MNYSLHALKVLKPTLKIIRHRVKCTIDGAIKDRFDLCNFCSGPIKCFRRHMNDIEIALQKKYKLNRFQEKNTTGLLTLTKKIKLSSFYKHIRLRYNAVIKREIRVLSINFL